MKEKKTEHIVYIDLPRDMHHSFGDFTIDPSIPFPVEIPAGAKSIDPENVTMEAIIAAMLSLIAYHPEDKHDAYYRSFVLAVQPDCVSELNTAAIAKEQQKDYDFAEELFLAVYHLSPQSASCINLATLYSYRAKNAEIEKDESANDFYLAKALHTLQSGLEKFGENAEILGELGSYEVFLGNLDEAQDYLARYLKVAEEGEKKQKLKKLYKDISFKNESDNEIKQAYDFIMLDEEEKALETIEHFQAKNPDIWHGHFIKGWALRKLKKYKEAEKSYLRCLELGERNSDIYNELSICELEKGNRDLAKAYLDTAVDMDEDNLTLISNLAFLHLSDGEYDEAREWLEKGRQLAPEDSQLQAMMREYTDKTGEAFADIIREEYVHDPEGKDKDNEEDDGYAEEMAAIAEDSDSDDECTCTHHDHEDGHCHCHEE